VRGTRVTRIHSGTTGGQTATSDQNIQAAPEQAGPTQDNPLLSASLPAGHLWTTAIDSILSETPVTPNTPLVGISNSTAQIKHTTITFEYLAA
jgi:hypothetical protein